MGAKLKLRVGSVDRSNPLTAAMGVPIHLYQDKQLIAEWSASDLNVSMGEKSSRLKQQEWIVAPLEGRDPPSLPFQTYRSLPKLVSALKEAIRAS